MIRKFAVLLTVIAAVGLTVSSAYAGAGGHARAKVTPVFDSHVHASVKFEDTGTELKATGTATGLKPDGNYISLLYDSGSSGRGLTSGGFEPCAPTVPPSDPHALTQSQMVLGSWQPMGATTRHLVVTNVVFDSNGNPISFTPGPKTGEFYTPLGSFASISVRRLDAGFALHACGAVVKDEADAEG